MVGTRNDAARQADLDALTRFVIANDDLERLESLLYAFNIFEALGVARQELRHSDFLAFLLDPNQPHGLRDRFLKRFLQRALSDSSGPLPVTPVEIELISLGQMVPHRERQNIDLLLLDEAHKIAVIIENKVGSGEHSGQLQRYLADITRQYSGWRIIPVFLSPDGASPSDERYSAIDYGTVAEIVVHLAESHHGNLEPEVFGLLQHYARLLRRYVVEDSEIADLCQRIYAKHKRAIDLIVEHLPGEVESRRTFLQGLIQATGEVTDDSHTKSRIWFLPAAWDIPEVRQSEGWTATGRILLFEFIVSSKSLELILAVGPGDPHVRQSLINAARAAGAPFKVPANPGPSWTRLYSTRVLTEKETAKLSLDEQQDRMRQFWTEFTYETLPQMVTLLRLPEALAEAEALPGLKDAS